ncbi:hypothetical protein ACFVYF_26140 [Streptomyces sp. NPDC058274]|uniref:hypothetical protein n=1 Tax=Streptomyces sp. NPDC058274 TaxID=3346416 RepID=UPI0036EFED8F
MKTGYFVRAAVAAAAGAMAAIIVTSPGSAQGASAHRDARPERIVHGREDFSFSTVNALVGTAPVIIRGTVLSTAPGRTVGTAESGGTDQARDVTLRVDAPRR